MDNNDGDSDVESTPRRLKKKSALSRFAAKKKSQLLQDDVSTSKESITSVPQNFHPKSPTKQPTSFYLESTENQSDLLQQRNNRLQKVKFGDDSGQESLSEENYSHQNETDSETGQQLASLRNRSMNSNMSDIDNDRKGRPYVNGYKNVNEVESPPKEELSSLLSRNVNRNTVDNNSGSNNNKKPQQQKITVSSATKSNIYNQTDSDEADSDLSSNEQHIKKQYKSPQQNQHHLTSTIDSTEEQTNSYKQLMKQMSNSDIDLRKHSKIDPSKPEQYNGTPKRAVSLSRAEMQETMLEQDDDTIADDLKRIHVPKLSMYGPSIGQRKDLSNSSHLPDRLMSSTSPLPLRRTTDLLSERSYASTSAMRQMTTQEAKKRSFLVGSGAEGNSLLGAEELERFFPDRQMRVFAGTWNMCEMKNIPSSLEEFIFPDSSSDVCDIYVIGTQESTPNRREWELRLQELIGPHHVLFHSAAYGVLYLSVFIRKDLIWYCSVSEESFLSVRAFSAFKTKGGVGICFTIFGTSLLFINCHFTPHDGNGEQRVNDYLKICKGLLLPKIVKNFQTDVIDPEDVTSKFDCVFWFGDMNWRILNDHTKVKNKIGGIQAKNSQCYGELLEHDELTNARNHNLAFHKFQEGRIKFPPTYKYDPGTNDYDTSPKMRIPSYTDRILFRTKKKGAVTCLLYNSVEQVKESDHRPVFGVYEVNLRPGRDNIPLAGGQFNREVWLTAMKRRALKLDIVNKFNSLKTEKNSSICSVM